MPTYTQPTVIIYQCNRIPSSPPSILNVPSHYPPQNQKKTHLGLLRVLAFFRFFRPLVLYPDTHAFVRTRIENERLGWQRPTLPHRYQCSTIGARGLNDRVRDGSGCTPSALATNTSPSRFNNASGCAAHSFLRVTSHTQLTVRPRSHSPSRFPYSRVPVSLHDFTSRKDDTVQLTISIGLLQPLLAFHIRPIQLVVF